MILPSLFGCISAKQSPPITVDCGSITASRAEAAIAASAAVPPVRSTSMSVSAASGWDVATMAFWEWTVDRPARWKFLMLNGSLVAVFPICRAYWGVTWHIQYHLRNAWMMHKWRGTPALTNALLLVEWI